MSKRRPRHGELLFHSDRGSQYASEEFTRMLDEHGITPSMSRKGNCWDNACSEALFGSLKVECLHGQRFVTIREAKDALPDWLRWYNRSRMHSTLGYSSPAEYEKRWTMQKATTQLEPPKKAGCGNMEIDETDFHIPAATTTTTR